MPEVDPTKLARIENLKRTIQRCERRIDELTHSIEMGQLPGPMLLTAARERVIEQKGQAEAELASLTG